MPKFTPAQQEVIDSLGSNYQEVGIAMRYSKAENEYIDFYVIDGKVDSISYILIP